MKKVTALMTAAACVSVVGLVAADQSAEADTDRSASPERSADAERSPADRPRTSTESTAPIRARTAAMPRSIAWSTCDDLGDGSADLRCADISVPADWERPDGRRTTVAVAKLPARDPDRRIGSLLVNLGGPGPSVAPLGQKATRDRLADLTRWFDVIAFDPRGIGASSGIDCPPAPVFAKVMLSPDRRTWNRHQQANRTWERACLDEAGGLAGNLDAWQVAHDMEAIRRALGDGGLRYYGNSYGTVYAQAYAELFPTRVDRMFLDSALDHGLESPVRLSGPQAEVVADEFRRFGKWCTTSTDCALYPENARTVWDELLDRAHREPLPAPDVGRNKAVSPDRLRFASLSSVVRPSRWPEFSEALAKARDGNASDLYVDASDIRPTTSATYLASCSDFPFDKGFGEMREVERQLRTFAPRAGWLMARMQYARCVGMRGQGSFPPHRIDPEGLPPVLLVTGLRDQATPPAHGRGVSDQLPGSVWIGAEADHAVYLDGNQCVRDITHRYLRTGELPEPGRICPADERAASDDEAERAAGGEAGPASGGTSGGRPTGDESTARRTR